MCQSSSTESKNCRPHHFNHASKYEKYININITKIKLTLFIIMIIIFVAFSQRKINSAPIPFHASRFETCLFLHVLVFCTCGNLYVSVSWESMIFAFHHSIEHFSLPKENGNEHEQERTERMKTKNVACQTNVKPFNKLFVVLSFFLFFLLPLCKMVKKNLHKQRKCNK